MLEHVINKMKKTLYIFILLSLIVVLPIVSYSKTVIKGASKVIITTPNPSNSSLVGYWTFDGKDMANGVAKDTSGNGNNGNLISIATSTFYAAGKIGQAGKFDGVNDGITTPITTQFGDFTACAWFKTQGTENGNARIIEKSFNTGFIIFTSSANIVNAYVNNTVLGSLAITSNQWHHVCEFRSGSLASLYVDGGKQKTSNVSVGSALTDTTTLKIGNGPGAFFNGSIDDVRIYNVALSTSTIIQLYNSGITTIKTGL